MPVANQDAFIKLIVSMIEHYGSENKVAQLVGMHSGHMNAVVSRRQNLSVSFAKKVLAVYKAMKNERT